MSDPKPPVLSREQRIKNLAVACAARSRRLEVKRMLSDGKLTVQQVLLLGKQDEAVGRLRLIDVILCLPGIGKQKAQLLLVEAGSPKRRLRGLGKYQTERALAVLKDY